ncbi:hypothetical protein [Roseibium sp.]|uniref:hypothetical protein n=1 Tax=Roseibium sp. TaxID=1936156 RepID=UPI003D0FB732
MKKPVVLAALVGALLSVAGCQSDGGSSSAPSSPAAPGNSAEAAAQQACLAAVKAETGNAVASVSSSEFSEAGTKVIVGVGDQNAPWECVAYQDGSTSQPMSLSNEGAL